MIKLYFQSATLARIQIYQQWSYEFKSGSKEKESYTNTHTQTNLVDDIDPIVDLLSAQDWVQIVKPVFQVVVSVPEWDNDGHLLFWPAVWRSVFPAFCDIWVLPLHPL